VSRLDEQRPGDHLHSAAMIERDALAEISKSRVDKAGERLRLHALGDEVLPPDQLEVEREVANQFRAAHGPTLQTVAANLAYHVRQETQVGVVGQRLKQLRTIEDKLTRHEKMKLSRMHDVGGCRAVVANEDVLREIEARLLGARGWSIKANTHYDYIANPKPDGYRAVHLVERRYGCQIEVQLRTLLQHAFAESVERLDRESRFGELKLGRAPDHIAEYYALAGALLASHEGGSPPDPDLLDQFRKLYRRIHRPSSEGAGAE
jgi:putative GTP pyrophosphokinase